MWKKSPVESCGICGFRPLDHVFPKGYPEDWKFCCSCLAWAQFLIAPDTFLSNEEKKSIIENSRTIRKIHDRITMINNG